MTKEALRVHSYDKFDIFVGEEKKIFFSSTGEKNLRREGNKSFDYSSESDSGETFHDMLLEI